MPINSLSPGYIKFLYTVVISSVPLDHHMVLPVNLLLPGEGDNSQIVRKNLASAIWTTIADEIIAQVKTQYNNGVGAATFISADLFSQLDENSEPLFESTHVLGVGGTVSAGTVNSSQAVFAFRGSDASILKLTLIESTLAANQRLAYAGLSTSQKAIVDYILGSTNGVWTRANQYPRDFLHMTTKINDKVRKHRFNL